ncbi:AsmA family protein [Chitinophaga lutea]|nr:AsmA-like C-terminal region-containing protein [Chitinophaga lutea]
MPRWIRISLISAGSLLALVIVLWLILALVMRSRKQAILSEITQQLSETIDGDLVIRDMEPSLLRGFPNISVTLKDVTLKDSLFNRHGHTLLDVREVFVKVNPFAILRNQVDIRQITLENGAIYLYTDSTGYSNTYLFKGKKKSPSAKPKEPTIRDIRMRNILFTFENQPKFKLYRLDIRSLRGDMDYKNGGWVCRVRKEIKILDLTFNTSKGSYAKDKTLTADVKVSWDKVKKILNIAEQPFRFDGQPVKIAAEFNLSTRPAHFNLHIAAESIPFRMATSLVTPNISSKLDSLDFEKPLNVYADVRGRMQFRDTPYVRVTWNTDNNVMTGKNISLERVGFKGAFLNEVNPNMGHNSANSRLSIYDFRAEFDSIPVSADTIRVLNLQQPVLTGRFKSQFPLTRLTHPIGAHLFNFTKGTALVDLEYAGGWDPKDTVAGYIKGVVQIKDGGFVYVPRNQTVQECQATLDFTGADLYFRNVRLRSGSSTMQLEGSIKNMLNFYFAAPEKIQMDWTLNSPLVNLNEFQRFFVKRDRKQAAASRNQRHKASRVLRQLEVVLEECSVNIQLAVNKIRYRQFAADNVRAGLHLSKEQVRVFEVALQTAGGSMVVNGHIDHAGNGNDKFRMDARIRQVQVDQLFRSFENFGQDGIEAKNLKGTFSATANITGGMREDATVKPHSMFGSVTFDLNKGALVHFEPLENLGRFVFRKRDMSNITFERIHNTLDIRGNKIIIRPMLIASSVLNIQLEGVYGMPRGTDIKMQVPLRNPKKDELVTDADELRKRRKSGIVINLNAVDDGSGKVKLKLGKGKDEPTNE